MGDIVGVAAKINRERIFTTLWGINTVSFWLKQDRHPEQSLDLDRQFALLYDKLLN